MPHSACLKILTQSRGFNFFFSTRLDGLEKKKWNYNKLRNRDWFSVDLADYLFIPQDWSGINLGIYQSGKGDKKGNSTF